MKITIPDKMAKRFRARVDSTACAPACWPWLGSVNPAGYGVFSGAVIGQKKMSAHRFAFLLANGELDPTLDVCHSCDLRSCVNPAHLRQATHRENIAEAIAKGSGAIGKKGAAHHAAKLTAEQVAEIRRRAAGGESARALAREFSISFQHVSDLKRGNAWASKEAPF